MQEVLGLIPVITKKREGKEKYISNIKHLASLKRREITVCPLQCHSLWSEGKMLEGTVLPVISGFCLFPSFIHQVSLASYLCLRNQLGVHTKPLKYKPQSVEWLADTNL